MENINDYEAMVKLELSDTERQCVSGLADMLTDSFAVLREIDTDGVEPLYTVLDICNVFREDIGIKTLTGEELLANAPERYGAFFQVPRTI